MTKPRVPSDPSGTLQVRSNDRSLLGEDLSQDLDDWDRDFDALIATSEAKSLDALDPEAPSASITDVMSMNDVLDASAAAGPSWSEPANAGERGPTLEDYDGLDDFGNIPTSARPATIGVDEDDIEESSAIDFPAFGEQVSMIGSSTRAASSYESDDNVTKTRAKPITVRTRASSIDAEQIAEDEVFTSALRPGARGSNERLETATADADFDDPIAPPPVAAAIGRPSPSPTQPPDAPLVPRSPAIIRRQPSPLMPPVVFRVGTPRLPVADPIQVPTLRGAAQEEDDYEDIEIGALGQPARSEANQRLSAVAIAVKTTSNVLRRNAPTTSVPPAFAAETVTAVNASAMSHVSQRDDVVPPPQEVPGHVSDSLRHEVQGLVADHSDIFLFREPLFAIDAGQFENERTVFPLTEDSDVEWLRQLESEIAAAQDARDKTHLSNEAGRISAQLGHVERAREHFEAAIRPVTSDGDVAQQRASHIGLRLLAMRVGDVVEVRRLLALETTLCDEEDRALLTRHQLDILMATGDYDAARALLNSSEAAATEKIAGNNLHFQLARLELAVCQDRLDDVRRGLGELAGMTKDLQIQETHELALRAMSHHIQTSVEASGNVTSFGAILSARRAAHRGDVADAAAQYASAAQRLSKQDAQSGSGCQHLIDALQFRAWQWGAALPDWRPTSVTASMLICHRARLDITTPQPDVFHHALVVIAETQELEPLPGVSAMAQAALANAGFGTWASAATHPMLESYAHFRLSGMQGAEVPLSSGACTDVERWLRAVALVAKQDAAAAVAVVETLADDQNELASAAARLALLGTSIVGPKRDEQLAMLHHRLAACRPDSLVLAQRAALASLWARRPRSPAFAGEMPPLELERWQQLMIGYQEPLSLGALSTHMATHMATAESLARHLSAEQQFGVRLVSQTGVSRQGVADDARTFALDAIQIANADAGSRSTLLRERLLHFSESLAENGTPDAEHASSLRLRAGQLAGDAGDHELAVELLASAISGLPHATVHHDVLQLANTRVGLDSRTAMANAAPIGDDSSRFAQYIKLAEAKSAKGDSAGALLDVAAALDLQPEHPAALHLSGLLARATRDYARAQALALTTLKMAEHHGDDAAIAQAHVHMADMAIEHGDMSAAKVALQQARQAQPDMYPVLDRLVLVASSLGLWQEVASCRDHAARVTQNAPALQAMYWQDAASALDVVATDLVLPLRFANAALGMSPNLRGALLIVDKGHGRDHQSAEQATNDDLIARYFSTQGDPSTHAAFLTRAGTSWTQAAQFETAIERFVTAQQAHPGYLPAFEGWRRAALKGQLWLDFAAALELESSQAQDRNVRAKLLHLAGVALMDKALVAARAISCLRAALVADPIHSDAFARLRLLLREEGSSEELAIAIETRLLHPATPALKLVLHRELAALHRQELGNRDGAIEHYREVIALVPRDDFAHAAIADLSCEIEDWSAAVEALESISKRPASPAAQLALSFRIGTLYDERLHESVTALAWFERALSYDPNHATSLEQIARIASDLGDWNRAIAAVERLIRTQDDPVLRVPYWHRVADIFERGYSDTKRAERAYNTALDGAPGDAAALDRVIEFYRRRVDMVSLRVHLGRVAGAMRGRIDGNVRDSDAYRTLAQAMSARHDAGVDGSAAIARLALEMQAIADGSVPTVVNAPRSELDRSKRAGDANSGSSSLLTPEADEVLFPVDAQSELRGMFRIIADRLPKHVGVDLRHYGISRSDKLNSDHKAFRSVVEVASGLGFGNVDIYVSQRQPWIFVAEPTSPVSLILGAQLLGSDVPCARFAAGAALKMAQSDLAIACRLPIPDLSVLVIALLRLFQPDFPAHHVNLEHVATASQRLRRLISNNQFSELRPFAVALDRSQYDTAVFSRAIHIASYRAGIVTSGSLRAALAVLANQSGVSTSQFLDTPVGNQLVRWALSEEITVLAR